MPFLNFFLACGFPSKFALKDEKGDYVCYFNNDGVENFRMQSDCDKDSEKHIFFAYETRTTQQETPPIPVDKCVLDQPWYMTFKLKPGYFVKGKPNNEKLLVMGDNQNQQDVDNRHFQAIQPENGSVKILNSREGKVLKRTMVNSHETITVDGDKDTCGNECYFIIEPILDEGTMPHIN